MDTEELKDQLGQSKKLLITLGLVVLFGVYMLWPSGSTEPTEESNDLDAELAALQASRGNTGVPVANFSGTDNRGITLGAGGYSEGAGGAVYETRNPDIYGVLVGYGTQTDLRGEYLVAYIKNEELGLGYEVDMRAITRYNLDPPSQWSVGSVVFVFGEPAVENRYIARSIQ